jgi:hypothetical protein
METGDFSQFDQTNASVGTLTTVPGGYGDATAARATYDGGGENGFSRGIYEVNWNEGDEIWYGAAFYLPEGFKSKIQGQVGLMRWDNYPTHTDNADQGGLVIYGSDRQARLVRTQLNGGGQQDLTKPFDLPEGRWFWVEVHQRLGAANALNEIYLDGALIDRSADPNMYAGRPIERIRYGLVAIADGAQTNPLTLNFDRARIGTAPLGPLPGLAHPPAPGGGNGNTGTPRTTPPTTRPASQDPTPQSGRGKGHGKGHRGKKHHKRRRVTRKMRHCVNRALKRAARRGDASGLPKATRRCVVKFGRIQK